MDSSGSIRAANQGNTDNWALILEFCQNLVQRFQIGSSFTNVGLVKFGNRGINEFFLKTFSTETSIVNAIGLTSYLDQNTNTSSGIYTMRTEQFTLANGDRSGITNVAIVLTDGESTFSRENTLPYALDAQNQGVVMYAVGITNNVNEIEVQGISSQPRQLNQNYFLAADFSDLSGIVDTIVNAVCGQVVVVPTPTPAPVLSGKYLLNLHNILLTEMCYPQINPIFSLCAKFNKHF